MLPTTEVGLTKLQPMKSGAGREERRSKDCGKDLLEVDSDLRSIGAENYAVAPNLTDTNFETPGSCMVTPYSTGAMLIVFLLWVMRTN